MGKKSLIKSTAKKKPGPKKAAAKARPKKKAPAKKTAAKKIVAKKTAAKAKPAAKPVKKAAPKKAAPKAKPVSRKELINKQFDRVVPKVLYTVPKEMITVSTFTAPELLAGVDADDAARIKGLLAQSYSAEDLVTVAEKAAAKKAAAKKAAAEKAAAEKAAAEKAAAEKAAAEKAAAEKAAAEKAAAEKAAAEKAAAEKAAAEKAAAIKEAAAQKSAVSVSYEPPQAQAAAKKPSDPVDNSIKLIAAGVVFLILLVIGASASNSFKYYLQENQGALEIWKGKFAPLGQKMVIALPGVTAPEPVKEIYSANEVYPLVFQYYVDKADALLDVPGIPDFEGIKATLKTALTYGATRELRDLAYQRLDNIDRLILLYKADVAASRGTQADLTAAIEFLRDANQLTSDPTQEALIAQKISDHESSIAALEEQAAAAQAAAEAEAARQAEEAAAAEAESAEAGVQGNAEGAAEAEAH